MRIDNETETNNKSLTIINNSKTQLKLLGKKSVVGLKFFGYSLRYLWPYVLSFGLLIFGSSKLEKWPFHMDLVKENIYEEKTITFNKVEKIDVLESHFNKIAIKEPWEPLGDGSYIRTVTEYPFTSNLSEEEIKKMLNGAKEEGFSYSANQGQTKIESKTELTEDEQKNNTKKFAVIIYNKKDNEFNIVEEDMIDEVATDVVDILFLALILLGIPVWRDEHGCYILSDMIDDMHKAIEDYQSQREFIKTDNHKWHR